MPKVSATKYLVQAGWDDVPHLDAKTKAEMLESTEPHLRDARSKGIPALGSGAVYPIAESEITCENFKLPDYWPLAFGMDVGWNVTANIWGAWDRESDVIYAFSEYYGEKGLPTTHANAIQARGAWIPGIIDPAARGRAQKDGERLLEIYEDLGLDLTLANNAVEAGILEVYQRLSTGRLKIFKTLISTLAEYRIYRREDGKIVKKYDHLMDALRYLVMSIKTVAITEPVRMPTGFSSAADTDVGY